MENENVALNKYELAYLLPAKMTEEEVLSFNQKMLDKLVSKNGIIEEQFEPKKRRLAYPIKSEGNAYFCLTYFSMPKEQVLDIEKEMKLSENILRFMIINHKKTFPKKWADLTKKIEKEAEIRLEKQKAADKKTDSKEEGVNEVNVEELNKKLKEILE